MPRLQHLFLLCVLLIAPAAWADEPPPLSVTLTPRPAADGGVDRLEVELRFPAPGGDAADALLRMPVTLVSTPTAAYEAADIQVRDGRGLLTLRAEDAEPTPEGVYRHYLADRAAEGDVIVTYAVTPRPVSSETRNGPLFDLRAQDGGLMGAGVYFFALPVVETPYRITLTWDLSALPAGARGVWSFGEGERSVTAPASTLAFSFYAVGAVASEPEAGADDFALYWLSQPPFDIDDLAAETRALYTYMSEFFNDPGAPYRVFIRENPYPAGGGTALAQSFMFGYGAGGETTSDGLQILLAHEMAHNWPRLNGGDPHALTAWYTEGTAEFYSSLLALRAGLLDFDEFLDIINRRADAYYANPHISLSNEEAGQIFWSDSRAQRIPYGRGFIYLANVDAQVRAASDGARSLDDLVVTVLARQKAGETVGLTEWVAMVQAEIGDAAQADFDAMISGQAITPHPQSFAPCLRPVQVSHRPFHLGFDEMRLGVVADLLPESAAARAGLAEGDEILSITPVREAQGAEDRMMEMTIRRDGRTYGVSYLPRGEPVSGWRWERVDGAPDSACAL
ncbi:MAG: hypothetical protein ACK4FB_05605 [Brevundimonas sp.]|uniref:hypothetical protein n=1 Tax=Brevundimonas sp. TaxID=1871086 RepID=UPI00391AA244